MSDPLEGRRKNEQKEETEESVFSYNSRAWDSWVERGSEWTVPVTPEQVEASRQGDVRIVLTPTRLVPAKWLGELKERRVLCLAGAGGQQGPLLAAAGALVTVYDASPKQLDQDRFVAEREGLDLRLQTGDMANLSALEDGEFDLIVHPSSNCFVPDVRPVWRECARVLRSGGVLLAGFANPVVYLFDDQQFDQDARPEDVLIARRPLPFSSLRDLPADERQGVENRLDPHEFGHSLTDQIAGQIDAGFKLAGFYEDVFSETVLSQLTPTYLATRSIRD